MLLDVFDKFLDDNKFPNIIEFVESSWGLHQKMFPVQKFIFKLIYGLPLDNKEKNIRITDKFNERAIDMFTEERYFKFLCDEGRINIREPREKPFGEVLEAIGRRGSKSTMATWLGEYELFRLLEDIKDPHTFFGLTKTMEIRVTVVSNTKSQASLIYNQIKEGATSCDVLRKHISGDPSAEKIRFFTPGQIERYRKEGIDLKDRVGLLSAFVGVSNSRNARGPGSIVLIMDEFAFFLDTNSAISDKAVYDALTPSVTDFKSHGKIILISSPLSKTGHFHTIYQQGMGLGDDPPDEDILVLRIPTWGMNPEIDSGFLRSRYKRLGKVSYGCEYGANFADSKSPWIEDEQMLIQCIDDSYIQQPFGRKYVRYYWGIDQGQTSDAFAIGISHKESDTVVLDYAKDYFGKAEECIHKEPEGYYEFSKKSIRFPQHYEDITAELKELQKRFPPTYGIMDQWSGTLFKQIFESNGIKNLEVIHFTDSINSEMYHLWFYLMGNKQFRMYDDGYVARMLLFLEKEIRSKNITIVQAPQRKGFHDDLADAIARSIYAIHNNKSGKSGGSSGGMIAGASSSGPSSLASYQRQKQRLHKTDYRRGFS